MKKLTFPLLFLALTISLFSQEVSTNRTPIEKFADVLVNYSLHIKPNERILIYTTHEAKELNLEVYKKVIVAGGYPHFFYSDNEMTEIFYQYANEDQLKRSDDLRLYALKNADAILSILARSNLKTFTHIDPEKIKINDLSGKAYMDLRAEKERNNELRWCLTLYPTPSQAQRAEMGTLAFKEFVFKADKLFDENPVKSWERSSKDQSRWVDWLKGKKNIQLKGKNIDMTLSVEKRKFIVCDGKYNFPDGEIYCSPVEDSANGWVKFTYPVIELGKEILDLELWFENGEVVKHKASKGDETIAAILKTDKGAKLLGELGIGTNYEITQYTNNILFDEKIGGTIHLAIGSGLEEAGGINESLVHLDMVVDMKESQIIVDGELFYENGRFVK